MYDGRMRKLFAQHFPTLAAWGLHDWIVLLLTTVVGWACVLGAFFPEGQKFGECHDCIPMEEILLRR